ncbi:anti-CBASS protein Acb1 family protein [Psychrobacter glaciei]|uniref:anti-CBASS protein Acb1 family protein n=1 Tax=Psychrobacter glaciei TaxID=619771 RepID=UPI003F4775AC
MLKQIMNIADSTLVNLVSKLGTSRDKASHDQFAWHVPKSVFELDNLYESNGTASKIIDKPVQDMFRQGYYFEGIAGEDLQKLDDEIDRLSIDVHLNRAMRLSRLHGKSYILLAADSDMPLITPFGDNDTLSYITTLSVSQLAAGSEMRPASEANGYYDRPVYYRLQKSMGGTAGSIVHHSRIIEVVWGDGKSVMEKIHDELLRFASVNANAASLVHEAKIDIIKTPDLANQIQNNTESILKRFALVGMLKGNNGTVLLDKEEEYQSKTYNFSGLPDLMQEFSVQLAAVADIPYTVLFGRSPAGMNATGEHDLKNYYDTVGSYQRDYERPVLRRLISIISNYLLPKGVDPKLVFSPLWQVDEKTLSEIEKNNAERDMKYLDSGVITEAQTAKQLVEQGTYTVIDDDHIKLLDGLNMELDDVEPTDTTNTAAE